MATSKYHRLAQGLEKVPLRCAVEISNVCTANCSFCAYRFCKRKKGIMDLATYKKVLAQLVAAGVDDLKFTPIVGDPLIDPRFTEKVRYAASLNHFKSMYTFTNLIGLKDADDFVTSGLTSVSISSCLQGKEEYKRIYGVDAFEKVITNLRALLDANERHGKKLNISVSLRHDKGIVLKDNQYFNEFKDKVNYIEVNEDAYDNWCGALTEEDLPRGQHFLKPKKMTLPCAQLYNGLIISYDGSVGVCWCRDYEYILTVGNINEQSLKEIWEGEALRKLRNDWFGGKLPGICTSCLMYTPFTDITLTYKFIRQNKFRHPVLYAKVMGSISKNFVKWKLKLPPYS